MKKYLVLFFGISTSISLFSQSNPMNFYTNGNAFYKSRNYEKAILNYSELIKTTDESLVIKTGHINRGLSKMHAEYLNEAKKDFHYVVLINSNEKMTENAFYWLSQINYKLGQMENVIANCNVFLRSNPSDSEMYFMRASAYSMMQNFDKSIKDYSKVIELYPASYQAYANRGVAKINSLTGNGNIQPSRKETKSACKDLRKAKKMGDFTVGDMIYIYCEKKK